MPSRRDGLGHATVVVLTALEEERRAVLGFLTDLSSRHEVVDGVDTRYDVMALPTPGWQIAVACLDRGNAATSALTTQAITTFAPAVVLLVGIAGGLNKDFALGDVVVATKVYGVHGGRDDRDGFHVRPEAWKPHRDLVQLAQKVDRDQLWQHRLAPPFGSRPPVAYFGPTAAGEFVLNNPNSVLARHVRHHFNDAIAIDSEDHGFAEAMHLHSPVAGLVIRGLSDLAGWTDKTTTDREGWRQVAASHAAAYAVTLAILYAAEHPNPPVGPTMPRTRRRSARRRVVVSGVVALASITLLAWGLAVSPLLRGNPRVGPSELVDTVREDLCSRGNATLNLQSHHSRMFLGGEDRPRLGPRPVRLPLVKVAADTDTRGSCTVLVHPTNDRAIDCLTVSAVISAKSDVIWSACDGGSAQGWVLESHWKSEYYEWWDRLHPQQDESLCLQPTTTGGEGTPMQVAECGDGWVQQWKLIAV